MNREQTMAYMKQMLETIANTPSPTGYTERVEALLMRTLQDMGFKPWQTVKGTVFVCVNQGEAGRGGLLLSAHVDTLGLMVRSIKANGRIRVSQVGGFPFNYVEQENVTLHTRDGAQIPGTIRMNEPAVHGRRDLGTVERTDENMELVLDKKTRSRAETEALGVMAGDFISLDPRYRESGDGFIKSRHMDDKASSAILLALAWKFANGELKSDRPVYFLFTTYEEVGHGASAGHPAGITDMIAVDMGVVADDLRTDEYVVSICAKDSGGPYNYALTDELIGIAKKNGLDFAVDVYPYYGSDAGAALRAGCDYRHALVGTGVAASHGYERIHEDGLWNTYRLLECYIEG